MTNRLDINAENIKKFLGIPEAEDDSTKMERLAQRVNDINEQMDALDSAEFKDVMDGLSDYLKSNGAEEFMKDMEEAVKLLDEKKLLTKEMSKELVKDTLKKAKEITKDEKTEQQLQNIIDTMDAESKLVKEHRKKTGLGKINEVESQGKTEVDDTEQVEEKNMKERNEAIKEMEELSVKEKFINYDKVSKKVDGVSYASPEHFLLGSAPSTEKELNHSGRYQEALKISDKLVRDIRNMKAHNVEDKTTGLQKGKLNRRQLYRVDKKVFMRKDSPQKDEADLSFYVALDHSGSTMSGLDIQIATVGLAVTDALEKLHIQHHVFLYDHMITPISEGNSRGHGKYVLAGRTEGNGGNDESMVMKHTIGVSERDRHKHQMLIIITDGDGYGEESALKEMKKVRPDMKVLVIGLNYDGGSFNKARAENIYGKGNVIVVKSQEGFSKSLTDLIKKEVLI